jgi:hypothetical protein
MTECTSWPARLPLLPGSSGEIHRLRAEIPIQVAVELEILTRPIGTENRRIVGRDDVAL